MLILLIYADSLAVWANLFIVNFCGPKLIKNPNLYLEPLR